MEDSSQWCESELIMYLIISSTILIMINLLVLLYSLSIQIYTPDTLEIQVFCENVPRLELVVAVLIFYFHPLKNWQ